MVNRRRIKILISVLIVSALVLVNVYFAVPEKSFAEEPGRNLIVRVQYFGDREDKIRTKAEFSRAQLEGMSAGTFCYSNVTRVGTVMTTKARGPKVTDIIRAAGIDLNSIDCIYFRTSDGTGEHQRYSRAFYPGTHLTAKRYYYPYLALTTDQLDSDGESIVPPEGSLDDATAVPAILAVESGSTKDPMPNVDEMAMSTDNSYRFCFGQSKLTEGKRTRPGYDGGDVSSVDSAYSIFGIDVVLKGYPPVTGVKLSANTKNLKIGSQTQIKVEIEGGDGTLGAGDLKWKSSNEAVAVVSKDGKITIKGNGTTTITARSDNGVEASITVTIKDGAVEKTNEEGADNGSGDEDRKNQHTEKTTKPDSNKQKVTEQKKVGVVAREISLRELNVEQLQTNREGTTSTDAHALEATEQYGAGTKALAGGAGLALFGIGAGLRYRRFRIDR